MPTDDVDGEPNPQGSMRFQDETTTPREPTLAERRAREQAERRRQDEERARQDADERKRRTRKRILIGAGVTVGIVAVVAVGYAIVSADDEVEAQCVDEESGVIVEDANCVTPVSSSSGGYQSGGFAYPVFIGVGGRQYRYNYGGSGTLGQPVSGGTATVPKSGTRVKKSTYGAGGTASGGTSGTSAGSKGSSSTSRGGLGTSSSGSSGS